MKPNQTKLRICPQLNVHEGFISAVCLLNDLMKMLVDFGIFNRVIFKDLGSDCYHKNKETNICCFKYDLRSFYDFTLRNITIG